ncbi:MAG TPA: MMPL family transporter [Candidatus Dormibacteraeota bacterium]
MFDGIAKLANNRAWFVAGFALAFMLVAGAFGGSVSAQLHQGGFTNPNSESEAASQALAAATGSRADRDVIALVKVGSITSGAASAEVQRVAGVIAADPAISSTTDFFMSHDPALVSKDGSETLVIGLFKRGADDDAIAASATRLETKFKSDPAVTLGGVGTTFAEVQANVQADLAKAESLAFPILFLLMLWVFRGVVAAALPLLVGGITVLGTFLGLRLVNAETPLSIFALNLATGLGLGLSIDYSLFMVSRFREELAGGASVNEAVAITVKTAGRTIFFSSLTVAAALAALMVFPLNFLFSMGVAGVIVVAIASTTALLVLPAVLRILGTRVNALAPRRWQRAESTSRGFWYSLSRSVMRRPIVFAVLSAAFLVALGAPFLSIKFSWVDATTLPSSVSAHVVDSAIKSNFPGQIGAPAVVVVKAPAADQAQVTALAADVRGVDGVEAVAPPKYEGHDVWRIDASLGNSPYDQPALNAVKGIRALPSSLTLQVSGLSASFLDLQKGLLNSLPIAAALVALTTLVILFLMTGSAILPIKSVLMNLLTMSATFGALVFVFQQGHLQSLLRFTSVGSLEQTQPVLLFALIFGLSTDYSVFLLSRIKEAHDSRLPNSESVALGLQRTGRIVTAAALLLSIAIGAFATSNIVFMKELGIGTVVGVLVDAFVVRALLVPALMGILGEWNWWAPGLLRRLHNRIGVSESPAARVRPPAAAALTPTSGTAASGR